MTETSEKRDGVMMALIFFLALVLRLAYDFFLRRHYFFYDHPSGDVTYYQEWAQQIARGDWLGHKAFYGLPLYPYFLAVLERLTLGHVFLIRLFHFILGSINCVLVYQTGKIIFNRRVGGLAAVLAATNFILIFYDWLMMPVTLLIFLSLVIVLALLHADSMTTRREWVILGVLIGLGVLGDGKFLIFCGLVILYLLFRWRKFLPEKIFTALLPLGLSVLLIVFGVCLRNKLVSGEWVFISAQNGLSFYVGNNPQSTGIFENPEFIRPTHGGQDEDQKIIAEALAEKNLGASEVAQFWRQKAMAFIFENPVSYVKLLFKKLFVFCRDMERAHEIDLILQRDIQKWFDVNPYFIICPLALVGMALTWKTNGTIYLNLAILGQLITTLIFFLTTRHRLTIVPFFLIYEAFFLWWLSEQIFRRHFKSFTLAVAVIFIFLFLFQPESIDSPTMEFLYHAKAGPIYAQQGEYDRAREHYFKALQLRPGDSNTVYNLGTAYLMEGNFARAQEFFQKAIQICHYNVDALFNLGYTYEQTGSPEFALKYYQEVLHYEPESLDVHFRIAQLYQKQKDCPHANEHYTLIMSKEPTVKEKIQQLMAQCY